MVYIEYNKTRICITSTEDNRHNLVVRQQRQTNLRPPFKTSMNICHRGRELLLDLQVQDSCLILFR